MSLMNAKAGDMLIVHRGMDRPRLVKVERTTKTRVFAGCKVFNRRGDHVPHQRWDYVHAQIATPEDIAEVEDQTRRNQWIRMLSDTAGSIRWLRELTTERLSRLAGVVEVIVKEMIEEC